jgi:hypothetical protein
MHHLLGAMQRRRRREWKKGGRQCWASERVRYKFVGRGTDLYLCLGKPPPPQTFAGRARRREEQGGTGGAGDEGGTCNTHLSRSNVPPSRVGGGVPRKELNWSTVRLCRRERRRIQLPPPPTAPSAHLHLRHCRYRSSPPKARACCPPTRVGYLLLRRFLRHLVLWAALVCLPAQPALVSLFV